MKDYTINNYCDILWISDLLEVKQSKKNMFTADIRKKNIVTRINFVNVIIFGVIVQTKQIGPKGFLYHVDDGTGVIACKFGGEQFEEAISIIETEQMEILNQTMNTSEVFEQSHFTDASTDDSIFNDKSIQDDEMSIIKKNLWLELQSIWNDIYESYTNLMGYYNIGDSVVIEGKLYKYYNVNQIYINCILPGKMDIAEELSKVSNKLKNGYYPLVRGSDLRKNEVQQSSKRHSGLMTFDHIHHLNSEVPMTRSIPEVKTNFDSSKIITEEVITPTIESTITFDTFDAKEMQKKIKIIPYRLTLRREVLGGGRLGLDGELIL